MKLSDTASDVAQTLDDSVLKAHIVKQTQTEASRSTAQLVDTISNLTTSAQAEIQKINNASAAFIQRTLLKQDSHTSSWLVIELMKILEFVLRGESLLPI